MVGKREYKILLGPNAKGFEILDTCVGKLAVLDLRFYVESLIVIVLIVVNEYNSSLIWV